MLKELKDIGKYVDSIQSPVESYITIPSGDFYIVNLLFDGEKFFFDENIKQGDKEDLIKMCYKPGKGRILSIFPNAYILIDKQGKIGGLDNIGRIFENLNDYNNIFKRLNEIYKNTDLEKLQGSEYIKNSILELPKKDKNKKNVTNIITIKIKRGIIIDNGLTPISKDDYLYIGDIQELKKIFLDKNLGEGAKTINGFCHVCEKENSNIIDFPNSTNVGFPYKFYNIDKKGFTYDLNQNNGYKSFGVCKDCYGKINLGYTYFKNKLHKNIFGEYCYLFPSIMFEDNYDVFNIFEKYDKQNLSKFENNILEKIKENNISIEGLDSLQSLFNFGDIQDKEKVSEKYFIKLNMIFGIIDGSNSDRLQINYFLKDILPSNLGKYYKSNQMLLKNNIWKLENEDFMYYLTNFLGHNKISENLYNALPELYLYPTYEKKKYVWSLKNFFEIQSKEEYYTFLDTYLHNNKYSTKKFWHIAYEKLKNDFKENYLKSKDKNLFFSIWEIYLVYIYMLKNELLDSNLKIMENIDFKTSNEKIIHLQEYFNNSEIFDSYDKIYASLIGLYVKLLLNKQNEKLKSMPFIERIKFEDLDYDGLLKLLNEVRGKFNKYAEKKFNYYPELYRLILDVSMKGLEKNLSRDEIVYYLSIGMEILPGVYFKKVAEKDNNISV